MENIHAAIVHGDALRAVLGADADEMITALAEEFDGLNDDGILQALDLEDGLGGGLFKNCVGDVALAGKSGRNEGERTGTGTESEEIAAVEFHGSTAMGGFKVCGVKFKFGEKVITVVKRLM